MDSGVVVLREQVQQANMLAAQGRWPEAVALYKQIIDQHPDNLELREQFIIVSFRNGDYRAVVEQYLECAEIDYAEGDWDSAIRRYEETLRLAEVVDGQHGPGTGDTVRALVAPLLPDIYYQFGDYHLMQGQADLALQYLEKSDQLSPGRWETHMALGQVYVLKGLDKQALGCFSEVIRLAPEEASVAYELMAEVFLRQGRELEQLRSAFYRAADAYYKAGNAREALRLCYRILDFDPENQTVLQKIHLLQSQVGP